MYIFIFYFFSLSLPDLKINFSLINKNQNYYFKMAAVIGPYLEIIKNGHLL
jgi:hypothetical protein